MAFAFMRNIRNGICNYANSRIRNEICYCIFANTCKSVIRILGFANYGICSKNENPANHKIHRSLVFTSKLQHSNLIRRSRIVTDICRKNHTFVILKPSSGHILRNVPALIRDFLAKTEKKGGSYILVGIF